MDDPSPPTNSSLDLNTPPQGRGEPHGRGVSVLVGFGIGVCATAIMTLVVLLTSGLLHPAIAGVYSGLAIGGLLLAVLGWFVLQE